MYHRSVHPDMEEVLPYIPSVRRLELAVEAYCLVDDAPERTQRELFKFGLSNLCHGRIYSVLSQVNLDLRDLYRICERIECG